MFVNGEACYSLTGNNRSSTVLQMASVILVSPKIHFWSLSVSLLGVDVCVQWTAHRGACLQCVCVLEKKTKKVCSGLALFVLVSSHTSWLINVMLDFMFFFVWNFRPIKNEIDWVSFLYCQYKCTHVHIFNRGTNSVSCVGAGFNLAKRHSCVGTLISSGQSMWGRFNYD